MCSRAQRKKLPPRLPMMKCVGSLKTSRLPWIRPIAPLMIKAEWCLRRSLLLDLSQMNLSGTSQTAVNNDILVMQKLLSSDNLSAESHLKALFDSSDKREYLGASVAADSYDRAADVRHLGPGQIQNTGLEQNALKRHGDNSLSAMQRKGGELIGKQAISLKDKTEGASPPINLVNAGLKPHLLPQN